MPLPLQALHSHRNPLHFRAELAIDGAVTTHHPEHCENLTPSFIRRGFIFWLTRIPMMGLRSRFRQADFLRQHCCRLSDFAISLFTIRVARRTMWAWI